MTAKLSQPMTLPLPFEAELTTQAAEALPSTAAPSSRLLALSFDQRAWLSLLAEAWWPVRKDASMVRLGVGKPVRSPVPEGRTEVIAWLDASLLPGNVKVLTRRRSKWVNAALDTLSEKDQQIVWPGPLPLFAISHFSVATAEQAGELISLAKGFANITFPEQPITVQEVDYIEPKELAGREPKTPFQPPDAWNALRGAATMAIWGAPWITPWVELLGAWLAGEPASQIAAALEAPWLGTPPWLAPESDTSGNSEKALWLAMVTVLSRVNIREAWRPAEILESIVDFARTSDSRSDELDTLLHETGEMLEDKRTVNVDLAADQPVAFVLQLILLRPKPENFITWKTEYPSLPPAVWWSGTILSGLIVGYRNLEARFRGTSAAQRLASIAVWQGPLTASQWPQDMLLKPVVSSRPGRLQLLAGGDVIGEKPLGRRGSWYCADFGLPEIETAAARIAQVHHVDAFRHRITFSDSVIEVSGTGRLGPQDTTHTLRATGEVVLDLPPEVALEQRFSADLFKKWLATGMLLTKLPMPPNVDRAAATSNDLAPAGIVVVEGFLSGETEHHLLALIDQAPWLDDLSRRVQHYGWKYDYTLRKVRQSNYLGPLPEWAQSLAERLVEEKLMPELADQVIVNEYLQDQSISKHVDCPKCFRGPIVTISLCESWRMIFRRRKEKFEMVLHRLSAVALDGAARHEWTHEIPARKFEGGIPRVRRVSLTFRKVDVSNMD